MPFALAARVVETDNGVMTRDQAGRAEPIGRNEDLRTMNTELLRTADRLVETMTELVAAARRLAEESQRLRREHRAITESPCLVLPRPRARRGHAPGVVRRVDDDSAPPEPNCSAEQQIRP